LHAARKLVCMTRALSTITSTCDLEGGAAFIPPLLLVA
jgi:hypothetical protein